jgi:chromate reductase
MSLTILGLSGSLRRASTNTALLRAFAELMPEGVELRLHDYTDLPGYNEDLNPTPESVHQLRAAISAADAVLIATPEYNHSVPGVLKNALDWASRPAFAAAMTHKPTGVVSAAASFVGGARAQQHLKAILLGMSAPVFPYAEFLVGSAHQKVHDGRLTDETTLKFARDYANAFAAWVARQK